MWKDLFEIEITKVDKFYEDCLYYIEKNKEIISTIQFKKYEK
jgi:hypothetical protein